MTGAEGPAFSVVITAFNEEELVGAAIQSVLKQTRADFELIVVDDGSTDETAAAVGRFSADPRLRLVRQENRGLSAARNTGIERSQAPLISFLDSDDLWLPHYLEEMSSTLRARPDAGFAYTDAWLLDDSTNRFRRSGAMAGNRPPADPPRDPVSFLRLLAQRNFVFVSTTVRREALIRAGLFDETLTACEDYDLWLRILAAGLGAASAGGRLAIKRDRQGMTAQHRNMYANLQRVGAAAARNPSLPDDVRQTARDRATRAGHEIARLDGQVSAFRALPLRARRLGGSIRDRLLSRRIWHPETPPEVASAFPGEEWRRDRARALRP